MPEIFSALTSNQFLATIGRPTAVEAEIGRRLHGRAPSGLRLAGGAVFAAIFCRLEKAHEGPDVKGGKAPKAR